MDRWKYHHIACQNHRVIDPISVAKLDEMIEVLKLSPGAHVLDIACGKGELLVRLARRYQIRGEGVDLSPYFAAAAATAVAERVNPPSSVSIVCADGREFRAGQPHDLAMCVGASWVYGGHLGTLRKLSEFVRPGGLVLTGEPFWRVPPPPEYLTATGESKDNYFTHAGNVGAGEDAGLIPLYSIEGSVDDWDRYEWLRIQAAERYAYSHGDDPDSPEILQLSRSARDSYLRWGRDVIGWALYLYLRP